MGIKPRRRMTVEGSIIPESARLTRGIGVTLPFNNPNGIFFQSYTNRAQIFSNLKNLLLTAKSERYMLPQFGTDLRFVLFENISSEEEFINKISNEIKSAIETWMPFLSITQLDVNLNVSDDGRVKDPTHAVSIKLVVLISSSNIYLPVRIVISESGQLSIMEAQYLMTPSDQIRGVV